MISGVTNNQSQCFSHVDHQSFQMFNESTINFEDIVSASSECSQTLVYNLSILKDELQPVQSLVTMVVNDHHHHHQSSAAAAASAAGPLIQDIIVAASSMLYAFQQAAATAAPSRSNNELLLLHHNHHHRQPPPPPPSHLHNNNTAAPAAASGLAVTDRRDVLHGFDAINNSNSNNNNRLEAFPESDGCDIIEIEAAYLLAKYTHYCQVCGKGFKRDANLRMHMRAHGDEYKTNAALSNPTKSSGSGGGAEVERKYSCPQEGCRWNRKHAEFQPLKSMICVKNHYKRSHCPKMYVCNRCNRKQFSVLSDLRTHEKHCGDLKWQCSCGTTFSRKDKLMGHVALFVAHTPDTASKIQHKQVNDGNVFQGSYKIGI